MLYLRSVHRDRSKRYCRSSAHQTIDRMPISVSYTHLADVKSVSWNYANWSIDKPEATIETPTANTTVIRPNGKGIGARSCWITVTVEDFYGNTVTSSPIKVRFYNWNWQIK